MALDSSRMHAELRSLLGDMPNLETCDTSDAKVFGWLGRVAVIVESVGDIIDTATFRVASDGLNSVLRVGNAQTIRNITIRTLSRIERSLPPDRSASFVAAGDLFAAFVSIADTIRKATREVFIVDPYMDDRQLKEFGPVVQDGAVLRMLTSKRKQNDSIVPAVASWRATYGNKHPVEARIANKNMLHDRFIAIDGKDVWLLSQSLRTFAEQSPATVVLFDDDLAKGKLAAYEAIWKASDPV